ncbi:hypothetical protein LWI29_000061 [Acer saccharum]|uniref:Uncharacterized protein n=1 Tax=Acer saccharum TaxID=4024 RepID=A0AA39RZN5_ACESA|nr:hypothetical protein LWI29_000061 [Acer saccharum]KAK1559490.1 hypothetical protein Q3G72_015051 [Acer saccharum]
MDMIDNEIVSSRAQGPQADTSENEGTSSKADNFPEDDREYSSCGGSDGSGKRKDLSISPDDSPNAKKKKEVNRADSSFL